MFNSQSVPYCQVVAAARDTAERICARGSRKVLISVTTLGGSTASVTWDEAQATLNLPTMPASTMLSRAEANQIVGLIAHECCHVMHTNWHDWLLAVREGTAVKELTNGIEDVRIELREIKRKQLPGLLDALSDTMIMMHGKSAANAAASGDKIGSAACHASYVIAILGRLANGYDVPNAKNIAADIDPRWRPAIDYALQRLPGLSDTAGARVLAIKVRDMLKLAADTAPAPQPQPPRPQPQQPPQDGQEGDDASQGSQEGQEGDDASQGSQEGQEDDDASQGSQEGQEDDDASQGSQEGQEGDDASQGSQEGQEGDDASQGSQEGQEGDGDGQDGDSDGQGDDQDGDDNGDGRDGDDDGGGQGDGQGDGQDDSQGANGAGGAGIDDDAWLQASPQIDDIAANKGATRENLETIRRSLLNGFRGARHYNRSAADNPDDISQARNRILRPAVLADSVSRLVLSEARNTNDRYLSAGRFDRRAIGRATWGASNVFSRRTYAAGIETAVFLLVDCSDSMRRDSRIVDAQALAYHLGQAIEDAGAKCAIAGFYTGNTPCGDLNGFDIVLASVKDWSDSIDLGRIVALRPTGTTPLSPAIIAASEQLAALPDVDRRICLPITDGHCDLGSDAVKDACAIAATMDVETGGIGIGGSTNCAATFPIGVDLGPGANVSAAGLNLLVDMLERGRA
jgi:hypothetical protein